jgi:hypothetical protein
VNDFWISFPNIIVGPGWLYVFETGHNFKFTFMVMRVVGQFDVELEWRVEAQHFNLAILWHSL